MFNVSTEGAVTVIQLGNPLVGAVVETFVQIAEQALRGGQAMVVFDMSEIPFVDGEGLELLLDIQDSFLKRGGRLKLTAPNPLVRDVMRITQTEGRFEVYDNVTLAIGSFAR